ncbi:hypothetical protein DFH11DRAFT_1508518 [Phellopilus nigrolimitatus]|nr:hypothetical protein DFH11DRAFT_1508518 [Phellopilus nigrolimitatus]
MIQHVRTDSENQNKWDSLQPESGDGYVEGSAVRPSTPIKQSASTSTYHTAGSSSFLHAPSLSVIAPTPRGSPGRSREESAADSELGEGLKVPTPPKSDKSKGKRKAEDSEDGSPPGSKGTKGKKTTFAERPQRNSNSSHAPSSFQSFQSQKSRKRVRLSSPATPDQSRPGSAQNASHLNSVSSRASSRSAAVNSHIQRPTSRMSPPRPVSRASRASRAMSASGVSSSGAGPRPKRSLSQSSIPLSAILSPRAPSVDRLSTFYMRDPQKPPSPRDVGWSLRFRSPDDVGSPLQAWSFWFGFLFPLLWWIASLWRLPKTRMVGTDTEKAITVDDPHIEREARTWRLRCRVASVLFFFTYAPVIILLAIFVPRS